MSIFTRIFGSTADCRGFSGATATYSTARNSTAVTDSATSTTFVIGQSFSSPNYGVYQGFFQFDTSALSAGNSGSLSLNASSAASPAGSILEISQTSALTNKIAGGSLGGLTQLGSFATVGSTGRITTALSGTIPVSATLRYVVYGQNERNNVAPTTFETQTFNAADVTGTTNDPALDILTGTAWDFVAAGTSVQATATSHILTEPAGVAAGDLLVACISSRIASTTSITLPSGWALVAEAKNNNTLSTSSALPSGMMAYILRGGSAPSYTFTHPVAPNISLGRVVAYRNVDQTTPADTGTTAITTGTAITAVSVTGLTTTADDDLIVALTAGGQEAAWSAFAATDPATSSGATADSVLDPIWGQWLERSDVQTTTGNDTSLAIFDAVKQTAGATGNLTATASVSAGHVVVAGSFKLVAAGPPTYDEEQEETAASAETVAGLLDATRAVAETAAAAETLAGLLVTEKAIAETAAAVETMTGGLAYTSAVEETTSAAETVAGQVTFAGAIAETAAAAETVTGQFNTTKAVAETATAADTHAALLTFTGAVAETAAAAETLTGGLAFDVIVAETAAAVETLTKTLTYTHVVAETVSAAETLGGLLVAIGAIAETASAAEATDAEVVAAPGVFDEIVAETAGAAETLAGLLVTGNAIAETASAAETLAGQITFTGAIVETAAAAETITKTLTFTGAIAETAAAADTVGGLLVRIGAVVETASAAETVAGLLTFTGAVAEVASAAETIIPIVVPAGGTLYEDTVLETLAATDAFSAVGMASAGVILETLAANDTVVADLISGEVAPPVIGGPGPAGEGVRRRFELYLLPEEEDEPRPRRKRKLRLKKAELEEKIEATVEYIEAGSPRPMSQQAMVAQVSTLMGLDALLEIDRRRVERTIYRYLQTLMEQEEEEGLVMTLLAA